MRSLWHRTWPVQPRLQSRTSWASDMGTSLRERTVSFETWSCHLTPSVVWRHRDWSTFSLSHMVLESVQHSHPCNTVGTISVWKSFTRSFTGRAVLRKTFHKDLKCSTTSGKFCTIVYRVCQIRGQFHTNDSVYSISLHGSWIASLSGWSTEPPSVMHFSVIFRRSMQCHIPSRRHWKRWGYWPVLSYSQQLCRCHRRTQASVSPMLLLEATWAHRFHVEPSSGHQWYLLPLAAGGRLKMRDWNYRHHQKCRGGKCRTGNIGTMLQGVENAGLEISEPCYRGWKMRDQAVMESQTPTCYGTHNMIYLIF